MEFVRKKSFLKNQGVKISPCIYKTIEIFIDGHTEVVFFIDLGRSLLNDVFWEVSRLQALHQFSRSETQFNIILLREMFENVHRLCAIFSLQNTASFEYLHREFEKQSTNFEKEEVVFQTPTNRILFSFIQNMNQLSQ